MEETKIAQVKAPGVMTMERLLALPIMEEGMVGGIVEKDAFDGWDIPKYNMDGPTQRKESKSETGVYTLEFLGSLGLICRPGDYMRHPYTRILLDALIDRPPHIWRSLYEGRFWVDRGQGFMDSYIGAIAQGYQVPQSLLASQEQSRQVTEGELRTFGPCLSMICMPSRGRLLDYGGGADYRDESGTVHYREWRT